MQDLGNNDIQYLYEKNGTHDPGGGWWAGWQNSI